MNGEERPLTGYQVFAMIQQVSRVQHRNEKREDGSVEETTEGVKRNKMKYFLQGDTSIKCKNA
jgi:hypothetical protein